MRTYLYPNGPVEPESIALGEHCTYTPVRARILDSAAVSFACSIGLPALFEGRAQSVRPIDVGHVKQRPLCRGAGEKP